MTKLKLNLADNRLNNHLETIIRDMESPESRTRARAIKQLGQMDLQVENLPVIVHSKLEKALVDQNANVRGETVMALAFLEGELAIPLLEFLMEDPAVCSNVVAALSFIGVTPSLDISKKMMNYLHSPEPDLRDRTARALGRLKVYQAKDALLELAKSDDSVAVRVGAVVGLGMLEDPQLKVKIRQLLHSETSALVIAAIHETLGLFETE